MKLTDRVYRVGSGALGDNQTDTYDCNIYLIDAGDAYILIDSGAGIRPEAILEEAVKDGLRIDQIAYILITHGHADHSGGAFHLQRLTGAEVICSTLTAPMLETCDEDSISLTAARQSGMYPQDYRLRACVPDRRVKHGERILLGNLTFEVIATPGHSFDMISIYVHELKAMFCSDVVFAGGKIIKLNTFDFSINELKISMGILAKYDVADLFPGHFSHVLHHGYRTLAEANACFKLGIEPPSMI